MSIRPHYILLAPKPTPPRRRSWLRQLFIALITTLIFLYVGFFAFYQIGLRSPLGNLWWLRFYDIFGYLLYLPLPLLLLLLVLPDQRRLRSIALAIPLLFFVYEYGVAFTPKVSFATAANAQSNIPLRMMTWNTYFGNSKVENLVRAVEREQPDILAVQEFGADYAKEFAAKLEPTYPYQLLYPSWTPQGYALFSRYPLQEVLQPLAGYNACPCIQALVTIGERQITVLSIHPTVPSFSLDFNDYLIYPKHFDTYKQDLQHEMVLRWAATVDTPLLVVGDFNATDRMPILDGYRNVLTDSYREAGLGFGFTFPNGQSFRSFQIPPLVRLDYIFHDASWRSVKSWTGNADGADHRYVVTDLVLLN